MTEQKQAMKVTEARMQELEEELLAEVANHNITRRELQRHIDRVAELEREMARYDSDPGWRELYAAYMAIGPHRQKTLRLTAAAHVKARSQEG